MTTRASNSSQPRIYTIGHSTRPFDDFVTLLLSFEIEALADVRNYPGSRWFPQFNQARMRNALVEHRIEYEHFKDLGGRKDTDAVKPNAPGIKRAKHHSAFDGYARYMKTEAYADAIQRLTQLALNSRVAFMCAEADWRKCHRSLMADDLKQKGWDVLHITGVEQSEPHAFTPYADSGPKLF